MNRPIIRFGLISAAILVGVNLIILLIFGVPEPEDYSLGEVIGYATIVVSLIPVYFAIKYYRDRRAENHMGFWRGVAVGVGVAAFPSVAFALYNFVYVKWIDPDFTQTYYEYSMESARSTMSAAEFQQFASEIEAQQAMFSDPLVMTVVMFLTVFLIGLVIAGVSALILHRKPVQSVFEAQ